MWTMIQHNIHTSVEIVLLLIPLCAEMTDPPRNVHEEHHPSSTVACGIDKISDLWAIGLSCTLVYVQLMHASLLYLGFAVCIDIKSMLTQRDFLDWYIVDTGVHILS